MHRQDTIVSELTALKAAAPTGYAIALHIRFATPTFLFQTYPKAWIDYYSGHGLVMRDPTVRWGLDNVGTVRWSELRHADQDDVLTVAARHGLDHGFSAALDDGGSRTIASFTRDGRDFEDAEVDGIFERVRALHTLTAEVETLVPNTRERLRRLSIIFTHP